MKFEHLTFHPHHLAQEIPALREIIADNRKMRHLRDYTHMAATAIHASVTFANGWTVSVITAEVRPGTDGIGRLFYADKHADTYEVMVLGPDDAPPQGPYGWQSRTDIDSILARVAGFAECTTKGNAE